MTTAASSPRSSWPLRASLYGFDEEIQKRRASNARPGEAVNPCRAEGEAGKHWQLSPL